ncbi:MAG: [protein-PII] uridylyltransferase [Pseudomonadota bacterium]
MEGSQTLMRPEGELTQRRAIIDRQALQQSIDRLLEEAASPEAARPKVFALIKQALGEGQEEIRRRFEAGAGGRELARAQSFLTDQVIRLVYDVAAGWLYPLANPSKGERLAVVAVGGYGRGELAPFSDVDLLFLLSYKMTPRSEQVVETVLYFLWDLGLKVGHSTRSLEDCIRLAKADQTIRTALLESRFLWGDQKLFIEFKQAYQRRLQARGGAKFIEAKLAERDTRHEKMGGSRYSLEPNIKDGKGGLRDLHTLFWIAKYIYRVDDVSKLVDKGVFTRREARRFRKAEDFLMTLRCHLHYAAGRAEERLTFDLQNTIAPEMGYTAHAGTRAVERLMKHYFLIAKDVGDLTRLFCAALEAEHGRSSGFRLTRLALRRRVAGFKVDGGRLTVSGPEVFAQKPVEMLRIFRVGQQHDLDIHPQALRWITQNLKRINKALRANPDANRIFLEILISHKDPEAALRRLNEAGVFGRFIPDFGRVVAQMQYNMYHHYTVDEHTIFALGILHDIEQGRLAEAAPIATEVVHKVLSRRVLCLAVLLHDIAKGRRGDHSVVGAEIALKLCPRLGLSAEETETVSWLVRHHLAMSDTAFKRDIDDPSTVEQFAKLIQSVERLRLLLVLTVADIRAVGPNTWTSWKAVLLRELYWRTEELLSGSLGVEGRDKRADEAKAALKEALAHWPKKEISAHMARGTPAYWLAFQPETLARHAELVRAAEAEGAWLTVDARTDHYRGVTEVTLYTADQPGLFSKIAGAMAVVGASIDVARIFTLANGMALDAFFITDARGGPFERPERIERLKQAIERTLKGELKPRQELDRRRSSLPSRYRVFQVQPRVLIDNNASARFTVIEVNGRDRPGLLYEVTRALTRFRLSITSAKISTFGERAVDVFYVQSAKGGKIENEASLKRIRTRLLEALTQGESASRSPVKP